MSEYEQTLCRWHDQGLAWAEAILVRAQHSSPLPPGARVALNERGETVGAISMGCVESDLLEHLSETLKDGEARWLHYGPSTLAVYEVGLTCGGAIDVLVRRQSPDEVWRAWARRDPARPVILLTALKPPQVGRQRLLSREGSPVGSLGDATLDEQAEAAVAGLWARGGYAYLELPAGEVFAEVFAPDPPLAIVGASPIAVALCRMSAEAGFAPYVVDPRRNFARAEQFPSARRVVHEWPEEGLRALGVDGSWFVAVLAHEEKLDVPALAAALRAECRYVGLLGSRRTQEKRKAALRQIGFSEAALQRIHGPIGLPCGALEPAEIAVSILAELIAVRRGYDARKAATPPAEPEPERAARRPPCG